MSQKRDVRQIVVEELLDLTAPSKRVIVDADRILADLMLTGDDATIFAMQAAKRLGVTVPSKEWRRVSTVGDAVALLTAYIESEPGK